MNPSPESPAAVIDVRGVTVRYGRLCAVQDVSLRLPRGRALGLLGANGAGKTSLLGALIGLWPATGAGTVLDAPFGKVGPAQFARIGFVSEARAYPQSWTVRRLLDYLRPMYATWDAAFETDLLRRMELPVDRPLGKLSRGMRMKAALVAALAFHPGLLVLDEPFSGLDPLTREHFIDGVLELMSGDAWSLVVSSHEVFEVERLCDSVAIIDKGRICLHDDLATLQDRFRRIRWRAPSGDASRLPAGWMAVEHDAAGGRWSALQPDFKAEAVTLDLLRQGLGAADSLDVETLDLRTILLAHLRAGTERLATANA